MGTVGYITEKELVFILHIIIYWNIGYTYHCMDIDITLSSLGFLKRDDSMVTDNVVCITPKYKVV